MSASLVVILLTSVAERVAEADTQAKLDAAQANLNSLLDKIDAETATVNDLQGQTRALAARLNDVQSQIAQTQGEIGVVRIQLRMESDALRRDQQQLDDRARAAYETGGGGTLEFLLGSASLHDLTDRLQFVDSAVRSDAAIIAAVERERSNLTSERARLAGLQARLVATRTDMRAQGSRLQQELDAAKRTLDSLQRDRTDAEALVKKLKDQKAQERAAARLAAQQRQATDGGGSGGDGSGGTGGGGGDTGGGGSGPFSLCPVDQPRSYVDDFGVPRPGGRTHQGNDVYAPEGTPIRAPFAGTAVNANNDIGGIAVTVYGPNGYAYNAHMSRQGALGSVSAGTVIGYVGNSGDAVGGPTHDHFEWHPGGGSAVDPYPFLNQVC